MRPERAILRSEMADLRAETATLRLRAERFAMGRDNLAILKLKRVDFRLES